jgi:hypothetical protein
MLNETGIPGRTKFVCRTVKYTAIKNRPGVVAAPGPQKALHSTILSTYISPLLFKDSSAENATIRYWAGASHIRLVPLKGYTEIF